MLGMESLWIVRAERVCCVQAEKRARLARLSCRHHSPVRRAARQAKSLTLMVLLIGIWVGIS